MRLLTIFCMYVPTGTRSDSVVEDYTTSKITVNMDIHNIQSFMDMMHIEYCPLKV